MATQVLRTHKVLPQNSYDPQLRICETSKLDWSDMVPKLAGFLQGSDLEHTFISSEAQVVDRQTVKSLRGKQGQ